jgi:hypothetical protein
VRTKQKPELAVVQSFFHPNLIEMEPRSPSWNFFVLQAENTIHIWGLNSSGLERAEESQ